jgi:hypothetical protein
MKKLGYIRARGENLKDGFWMIGGRRPALYGQVRLTLAEGLEAVKD